MRPVPGDPPYLIVEIAVECGSARLRNGSAGLWNGAARMVLCRARVEWG